MKNKIMLTLMVLLSYGAVSYGRYYEGAQEPYYGEVTTMTVPENDMSGDDTSNDSREIEEEGVMTILPVGDTESMITYD